MPKVQRAKQTRVMKGRPITTEEFERMLAKVPAVVGDRAAESWRHLLEGLWWSGLRLGESLAVRWDYGSELYIDTSGDHPALRIFAEGEKGHKDRLCPLVPEFCEFLEQTPEEYRTGYVFNPVPQRKRNDRMSEQQAIRTISEIGK